jgi:sugar fermentation stimulation protein A
MRVEINGDTVMCHCPSTGKIGKIVFNDVPCLLSVSHDKKRKTACTVEAISINKAKSWIGINQNAVNRYVEHFFRVGALSKIVENGHKILREQRIGASKLDFKIENTYIELKMPLKFLAFSKNDRPSGAEYSSSHERFVRHVTELKNSLQKNERAFMLVCFVYDAPSFKPPAPTEKNKIIGNAVQEALLAGVKIWQINMSIDPQAVSLLKYFDITESLFL